MKMSHKNFSRSCSQHNSNSQHIHPHILQFLGQQSGGPPRAQLSASGISHVQPELDHEERQFCFLLFPNTRDNRP
jgi:hypothetical protein